MKKLIYLFLLIVNFTSVELVQAKAEIKQIHSMREAYAEIKEKAERYGAKNVLVVFDLDSTLLALNQDLGSDYWFTWQNEKIKSGDRSDRVASSILELLAVQLQLYTLSGMHPPEKEIPAMVASLQNRQIAIMVLTSRMTDFGDITLRQLRENRLSFVTSPEVNNDDGYNYIPYDPRNPQRYGLDAADVDLAKLKTVPPVNYKRGIFLSAGLHKGVALKSFLGAKAKSNHYRAIVFVDDRAHHCQAVAEVYKDSTADVVSLRYGFEDKKIEAFLAGPKTKAINGYQQFIQLKEYVFN